MSRRTDKHTTKTDKRHPTTKTDKRHQSTKTDKRHQSTNLLKQELWTGHAYTWTSKLSETNSWSWIKASTKWRKEHSLVTVQSQPENTKSNIIISKHGVRSSPLLLD